MKIQNVQLQGVNPYRIQEQKNQQIKQEQTFQDKLEISKKAQQLSKKSTFEVAREQKVAELKAQVENGTYKIDHQQLASKLLKEFGR